MAVAGTYTAFDAKGIREDLADVIHNIAPTDCPFMGMVGRSTAKNVKHEWQTDTLDASPGGNAQIEGVDAPAASTTPTVRLFNLTQIATKTIVVSGTLDAVDKAGRTRETAYQIAKHAKELKRDMETDLTGNVAQTTGGPSTARTFASLEVWYETNQTLGTSTGPKREVNGFQPVPGSNVAYGTTVALTLTMIQTGVKQCWDAGGNPDSIMVGSALKQAVSDMSTTDGVASTRFAMTDGKTLVQSIDLFISDFGQHKLVPNRFSNAQTVHILDKQYWKVAYLRPFKQVQLATTGDAAKRELIVEYTLEACNEAASAAIFTAIP